jgi:competence protein ComFC
MKILKAIFNIVFPQRCVICKKINFSICESCLSKAGLNEKETDNFIFTIYDYRDTIIRKTVWALKYKNRKDIARVIAEILHPSLLEELSDLKAFSNFTNPILIPIPLSKKRLRERGYNQALLICKELIKIDEGKNFSLEENILIKIKETTHQAHIKNRRQRMQNLIGTFGIKNEEKIKKRNIILIDDVVTTGATLREAKKILKNSGAQKIIALTFAH